MASGFIARCVELIHLVKRSEVLDELPGVSLDTRRASFVSKLLKAESLPFDDPVPVRDRAPLTSRLFASETLPFDERPGPDGGRTSFIATLFSREALPVDQAPGPGPVGRGPRG
jgi:hypothetical protein